MRNIMAIAALLSVVAVPIPAQARQDRGDVAGMGCFNILQVADALRLATPAQIAAYHARLAPECRARLQVEASLIVGSEDSFAMRDGEVWIPAKQDCGCGASARDMDRAMHEYEMDRFNNEKTGGLGTDGWQREWGARAGPAWNGVSHGAGVVAGAAGIANRVANVLGLGGTLVGRTINGIGLAASALAAGAHAVANMANDAASGGNGDSGGQGGQRDSGDKGPDHGPSW